MAERDDIDLVLEDEATGEIVEHLGVVIARQGGKVIGVAELEKELPLKALLPRVNRPLPIKRIRPFFVKRHYVPTDRDVYVSVVWGGKPRPRPYAGMCLSPSKDGYCHLSVPVGHPILSHPASFTDLTVELTMGEWHELSEYVDAHQGEHYILATPEEAAAIDELAAQLRADEALKELFDPYAEGVGEPADA